MHYQLITSEPFPSTHIPATHPLKRAVVCAVAGTSTDSFIPPTSNWIRPVHQPILAIYSTLLRSLHIPVMLTTHNPVPFVQLLCQVVLTTALQTRKIKKYKNIKYLFQIFLKKLTHPFVVSMMMDYKKITIFSVLLSFSFGCSLFRLSLFFSIHLLTSPLLPFPLWPFS
jgi:hypothetical protein